MPAPRRGVAILLHMNFGMWVGNGKCSRCDPPTGTSICILAGVGALRRLFAQLDTHGDHIEADRLAQIRPGVRPERMSATPGVALEHVGIRQEMVLHQRHGRDAIDLRSRGQGTSGGHHSVQPRRDGRRRSRRLRSGAGSRGRAGRARDAHRRTTSTSSIRSWAISAASQRGFWPARRGPPLSVWRPLRGNAISDQEEVRSGSWSGKPPERAACVRSCEAAGARFLRPRTPSHRRPGSRLSAAFWVLDEKPRACDCGVFTGGAPP